MAQARVFFYGLAVVYLVAIVVQFFLAGLWAFGASSVDAHRVLGLILTAVALILLVLALVAKLPRTIALLAAVLVGLNVLQIVLVQIDIAEIAAFHVVNAIAVLALAYVLTLRSRRYLAARLTA